jgi:hypothetical protein
MCSYTPEGVIVKMVPVKEIPKPKETPVRAAETEGKEGDMGRVCFIGAGNI